VTILAVALLALAVAVLIGAEWPRLEARFGAQSRRKRERERRKAEWQVLTNDSEEFAASVERDLAGLPTIDEREENGRRR
jgi:hypothetical protein